MFVGEVPGDLFGADFRITRQRGALLDSSLAPVVSAIHPSAILRGPPEQRHEERRVFRADLATVARALDRP